MLEDQNLVVFGVTLDITKSVCIVETNETSICGKEIKGQYPTNLKKHLRICHNDEYKCFEAAETKRIKEKDEKSKDSTKLKQSTLPVSSLGNKPYESNSRKHQAITLCLATFIGANNVALSLVDNSEFRELIEELDPRYTVPHRKKMGIEIERVYQNVKAKISESLKGANKISICTDIWSTPGMTASFLGITAHYFCSSDNQRHTITLAVRHLPSPHTAEMISETVEDILLEWNIPKHNIFRILTDNGSNMVATFKTHLLNRVDNGHEEDEHVESNIPYSKVNDITINEAGDSVDEVDDFEDLEDTSDLEFDSKHCISNEISNFEQTEWHHNEAFIGYKRLSCFIHTLQLVIKIFEANPSCKNSLQKAHSIVKKVNKLCKATEKLTENAGKKLIGDCPTRWDSTYLMISRLLDVKHHLTAVLDELTWDSLTATQWKNLEAIQELLQPFAHHTNITGAENSTTIAMVIPVLKELNLHLEEMSKTSGVANEVQPQY